MPQLVTINGTLAGIPDIFTHTITVNGPPGDLPAVAAAALSAWENNWTNATFGLQGITSNTVSYVYVTAAEILDLGPVDPSLSAAFRVDFAVALNGTVSPLPGEVATVVTLRAGVRPNGTPLRGRFYLPPLGQIAVQTLTGLMTTASQARVLDFASAFLDELISESLPPAVWSRVLATTPAVDQVQVGDHFDVMRSRGNAALETYVSEAVPSIV